MKSLNMGLTVSFDETVMERWAGWAAARVGGSEGGSREDREVSGSMLG